MRSLPNIGTSGEFSFVVGPEHTITFSGDGMPAVLSTPQLIGLLEQTAREAVAHCLDPDERTVGTEIDIRHFAPTPPGQQVTCKARVVHVEDRVVTFQVEARDTEELLARGIHRRSVIRVESFARRVTRKKS
jgi:fluoroacetyl-CoA thioesterase